MLEWWVSSGFVFYYILSHMTWRPLQKKASAFIWRGFECVFQCLEDASEQSCSSLLFSTISDFVLIICI